MTEVLSGALIALPLGAAALVPLLGRAARPVTLGLVAAHTLIALRLLLHVLREGPIRYAMGGWPGPWGIEIQLDPLSVLLILLISFMATRAAAASPLEVGKTSRTREGLLYAAVMLLLSGLVGIVATRDLFNLFVFLEISSLAAYALIAGGGRRAAIASFRYLLVGTAGGSLYLLGIGFLYAVTGTLNMDDLTGRLGALPAESGPAVAVGVALIATGLALKAALFPLHGWLPDTYAHMPPAAAGFIAAVMAKVSAFAILRVVGEVAAETEAAALALDVALWLGIAGALVGGALAVAQTDVVRMLAWSSVGAMGTILLGIAIGSELAIAGATAHMIAHALAKGALFFGAGSARFEHGLGTIRDWAGFGARAPLEAVALSVAALSLIGLPPAAGFFSKYLLLAAAWETNAFAFAALLVSSVLSAVYFLRLLEAIWFRKPASDAPATLPLSISFGLTFLAVLTLTVGFFAGSWPP